MKKLLSVVLAVSLLVTAFAGCGKKDDDEIAPYSRPSSSSRGGSTAPVRPAPAPVAELTETENGAMLTMPYSAVDKILNEMAAVAVNQYMYCLVKLAAIQEHEFTSQDELIAMNQELLDAYRLCEALCVELDALAISAETRLAPTSSVSDWQVKPMAYQPGPLALTPVAAGGQLSAKEWAEGIVREFDSAPHNQGIKKLAELLGTDSKRAMAQLQQAQNMIEAGDWNDIGDSAQFRENTWRAIGATAKVSGVIVGAAITGGGSVAGAMASSVSMVEKGCLIIDGVDAIISVGETSATIIAGENSRIAVAAQGIQKAFEPVAKVSSIISFGTAIKDAGKAINNARRTADTTRKLMDTARETFSAADIDAVKRAHGMAEAALEGAVDAAESLYSTSLGYFGNDIAGLFQPFMDESGDKIVSVGLDDDGNMVVKEIDITGMTPDEAANAMMDAGIIPPIQDEPKTYEEIAQEMEEDGVLTDEKFEDYLDKWVRDLAAELLGIDPADVTEEQMNEVRQIVIDTIDEMYGEEESEEESDEEEESDAPVNEALSEFVGIYNIQSVGHNGELDDEIFTREMTINEDGKLVFGRDILEIDPDTGMPFYYRYKEYDDGRITEDKTRFWREGGTIHVEHDDYTGRPDRTGNTITTHFIGYKID